MPIYEGHTCDKAVNRLMLGGQDVTEYLHSLLLKEQGLNLRTKCELEIVRDIKEKTAFVCHDFDQLM